MTVSTILVNGQNSNFLKMLEYAIKAPSGHNTQPWKFKVNENSIEVYPNFDQELPIADSNHRELYISLGCAVENICIASNEFGYSYETEIKQQDSLKYIKINLKKSVITTNPLFSQIDKRQTNRSVYKSKTIPKDTISLLEKTELEKPVSIYFYENGDNRYSTLAEYVYRGNEILFSDKSFKKELLEWTRFNSKHIQERKDGLAYNVIGSPSLPQWLGKPIVSSFLKPKTQNKSDRKKINSSSHFVLFTTKENTIEDWILTGRTLERFLLKSSELEIAVAYVNQPCQVSSLSKEVQEKMPIDNEFPMLLLRIGYADEMPYAERKNLEKVIIE